MLSSRSFVILKLIFRSMVQLDLIFVCHKGENQGSFLLLMDVQLRKSFLFGRNVKISGRRVLLATTETKLKGKVFPLFHSPVAQNLNS